jgi:hypothetical protein
MLRLRQTLNTLDPLSQSLVSGAKALGPSATATRSALVQAMPLLRSLTPLSNTLNPAVNNLRTVGSEGVPVIDSLNNTVQRSLTSFIPWLNSTDPLDNLKVYEEVGPTIAAANSAVSIGDKVSPMANFGGGAGLDVVGGIPGLSAIGNTPNGYAVRSGNVNPSDQSMLSSPCGSSTFAKFRSLPGGTLACELLMRVVGSAVSGLPASQVNVPNSLVSPQALSGLINGLVNKK